MEQAGCNELELFPVGVIIASYATLTDYWFSQDLQAFVLVKRTGPGKSQHTIKVSDISPYRD
jgi:hypothetical protein